MKGMLIVFLLFCSNFLNGQTIPKSFEDQTTWQTFKYDISSVFKSSGHAFSRPAHWKGKQWLNFAGIATGTTLVSLVDDEFDHWADGFRNDIPNGILDFGGHYARPEGNYGLAAAVYFRVYSLKMRNSVD